MDKIEINQGIPKHCQRLIFGGKQLKKSSMLNDYKIRRESTLQLLMRMPGSYNPPLTANERDILNRWQETCCPSCQARRPQREREEAVRAEREEAARAERERTEAAARARRAERAEAERAEAARAVWTCLHCTTQNKGDGRACYMCNRPRATHLNLRL